MQKSLGLFNTTLAHGTWTDDETILLIVFQKVSTKMGTHDDQVAYQAYDLYQHFLKYNTAKNHFQIREKTASQVKGKITSMKAQEKFEE